MSGSFECGSSYFYVSNVRFRTYVEYAIEVGGRLAQTDAEQSFVAKLREFEGSIWPGIGLDLEKFFVDIAERKFWSVAFLQLAGEFYERQRGDHSQQGRLIIPVIAECYTLSRMLCQLVNQTEPDWNPLPITDEHQPGPFRLKCLP